MRYAWIEMEKFVREFYFEWKNIDKLKTKKIQTIIHIESSLQREIFITNHVYLSDLILAKHRYLITMVGHFFKYGWAKQAIEKLHI